LLQKLLLERTIFRFVGHPLKSNGMLKIFREHFHVHGTSVALPVHAHNQPASEWPCSANISARIAAPISIRLLVPADSVNFCFIVGRGGAIGLWVTAAAPSPRGPARIVTSGYAAAVPPSSVMNSRHRAVSD
jgi:hypothetical protein